MSMVSQRLQPLSVTSKTFLGIVFSTVICHDLNGSYRIMIDVGSD